MSVFINGWTKESVIKHIKENFKGKAVAKNPSGMCQYLTSDGKKCAVGLFIPDGHPGQKAWGNADTLLNDYPDLGTVMPLINICLGELQIVHDLGFDRLPNDTRTDNEVLEEMLQYIKGLQ